MPEVGELTVASVAEALGLAVCASADHVGAAVTGAVVGDLLSHVMARGKQGNCWVTIQTHPNLVAVAALGGLSAIIIADGFEPEEDTVARADEEGIALLTSPHSAFTIAGQLYELGVR